MRFQITTAIVLLSLLLALSGCVEREREDSDGVGAEPAVVPDTEEVEEAARSSRAFGFDMFNELSDLEPEKNVITSPYSAAAFLMLLLNGADGETRQAIGDVLHLDDPFDERMNSQHQKLAEYLTTADADVELVIANSLWANEGFRFEDDYMEDMRDYYGAQVEEVDLSRQEVADRIDQWVSEQTNELIEEIADDLGLPDSNSVLVLLNAVYFLGGWTEPFDPDRTEGGSFTLPGGDTVEVPLMKRDGAFLFSEQDDFTAIRMPYGDQERFGMDVFLPSAGTDLTEFRATLHEEQWRDAISDMNQQRVEVTFPAFELEYETGTSLKEVLTYLGMGIAFDGGADFSEMSPGGLWLDSVIQKTYIRVDEEGTEAAAVTGGDMVVSMPPQFQVDRPFIFTISDIETGTILFLGQVNDPSD